jgi:uncharacterized oxidoreductase
MNIMNTQSLQVLITGGSAGIGYAIAQELVSRGNKVLITGRDEGRLKKAAESLGKAAQYFVSDVSRPEDRYKLVAYVQAHFSGLNLLINNAGAANLTPLYAGPGNGTAGLGNGTAGLSNGGATAVPANGGAVAGGGIAASAAEEINTNYLAVADLNERLIPLLEANGQTGIVNVSSIVAFVPGVRLATYSASKAALHAYTRTLRFALSGTAIKVFELMPPLVNTDFSKEIGGENGISPKQVADDLIHGLEQNTFEIRVGQTEDMYRYSLSSPEEAFLAMNASRS